MDASQIFALCAICIGMGGTSTFIGRTASEMERRLIDRLAVTRRTLDEVKEDR